MVGATLARAAERCAKVPSTYHIRILEQDSNRRGDLFGRLVSDLFLALGYDEARLNVHKSGREIDIQAQHRTEPRRVVAECKATEDPVGGDQINKFVGALDAERRQTPGIDTVGYFVSLSGFRPTAIEQEEAAGGGRLVLMDSRRVIEELIRGRILVDSHIAIERAGRCAAGREPIGFLGDVELLAHEIGWVWAPYFASEKVPTHFALIHADGTPLGEALARRVVSADAAVGGSLTDLSYLPPCADALGPDRHADQALAEYVRYIEAECGQITFEGLPADEEVGYRQIRLESLFVPLWLSAVSSAAVLPKKAVFFAPEVIGKSSGRLRALNEARHTSRDPREPDRESLGSVLREHTRLAVLAPPGGGKTTLLKRLALSYAFPERRKAVADDLPDEDWLPLFVRCRQLQELVHSPITEVLRSIPRWAEMPELAEDFASIVSERLRTGEALLLVDGLDEIADDGARISFVKQLRTFLARYPQVNLVVTSREAGFRVIGGALAAHCRHYQLAEFTEKDISKLTVDWHKELIGDREEVVLESKKLATTIWQTDRVRRLAVNPLLLTTLLMVKRWVGQLPTRRSVLYEKAIEVLLMTWNVEAHHPLDQDEVVPQLAYLAFVMTREGAQRVSQSRLASLLRQAREELPEYLAYARLSVTQVIEQVELRSSLLTMIGHDVEDGKLQPFYEFRHLTFQEYLSALAIAEGYYPKRTDSDTLLSAFGEDVLDQRWREVVPLCAVLSRRKASSLISDLLGMCRQATGWSPPGRWAPTRHGLSMGQSADTLFHVDPTTLVPYSLHYGVHGPSPSIPVRSSKVEPHMLIAECILDEAPIPPPLLTRAICVLARSAPPNSGIFSRMYDSKYRVIAEATVETCLKESKQGIHSAATAMAELAHAQRGSPALFTADYDACLSDLLLSGDPLENACGIVLLVQASPPGPHKGEGLSAFAYAVSFTREQERSPEVASMVRSVCVSLLSREEPWAQFVGALPFASRPKLLASNERDAGGPLRSLAKNWCSSEVEEVRDVSAHAITSLPVLDPRSVSIDDPVGQFAASVENALEGEMDQEPAPIHVAAALVVAFYLGKPWAERDLAHLLVHHAASFYVDASLSMDMLMPRQVMSLLKYLGHPGRRLLKELVGDTKGQAHVDSGWY